MLAPASEALPEWGKAAAAALEALDLSDCNSHPAAHGRRERAAARAASYFRGIEYYLPYLYPRPATLLDYLPGTRWC